MISISVARCRSVLDNEVKDMQSLWIVQFMCAGLAFLFIIFGPAVMALFPVGIGGILMFPMIDTYRRWHSRLQQLLETTRNLPVDIDF